MIYNQVFDYFFTIFGRSVSLYVNKIFFYSWYRDKDGHLQQIHYSPKFEPLQDVLLIRKVKSEDAGRWTCKASNNFGEQRLDIHLTVTAHLSVHVTPSVQVYYNIFIVLFSIFLLIY